MAAKQTMAGTCFATLTLPSLVAECQLCCKSVEKMSTKVILPLVIGLLISQLGSPSAGSPQEQNTDIKPPPLLTEIELEAGQLDSASTPTPDQAASQSDTGPGTTGTTGNTGASPVPGTGPESSGSPVLTAGPESPPGTERSSFVATVITETEWNRWRDFIRNKSPRKESSKPVDPYGHGPRLFSVDQLAVEERQNSTEMDESEASATDQSEITAPATNQSEGASGRGEASIQNASLPLPATNSTLEEDFKTGNETRYKIKKYKVRLLKNLAEVDFLLLLFLLFVICLGLVMYCILSKIVSVREKMTVSAKKMEEEARKADEMEQTKL